MARPNETQAESRRGNEPAEEEYLTRIGERLRQTRSRLGMSRKVLSLASGVSERYLAEMERGAGNASLLVVRRLAAAMGVSVSDLAAEQPDRAEELNHAIQMLERLTPTEIAEAQDWLARRIDDTKPASALRGKIANGSS